MTTTKKTTTTKQTSTAKKPATTVAKKTTSKTSSNRKTTKKPETNEDKKVIGVLIMLLGMVGILWQGYLYLSMFFDSTSLLFALKTFVVGLGNIAIFVAVVYLGAILYVERKTKIAGWIVLGWTFVIFGYLGIFHVINGFTDISTAFNLAIDGAGGGIFGFMSGVLVSWLNTTMAVIILLAFILVGLMLGTNMQLFKYIGKSFLAMGNGVKSANNERMAKKEVAIEAKPKVTEKIEKVEKTSKKVETKPKAKPVEAHVQTPIIYDYWDLEALNEQVKIDKTTSPDELMPTVTKSKAKAEATYISKEMTRDIPKAENPLEFDARKLDREYQMAESLDKVIDMVEPSVPIPAELRGSALGDDKEDEGVKTNLGAPVPYVIEKKEYKLPPTTLLSSSAFGRTAANNRNELNAKATKLVDALASFGVKVQVTQVVCGPSVTRYELQPAPGVKVSKIVNLADDIALTLAAKGLRIEAPVPGKSVVGIEIANEKVLPVFFKDIIDSREFKNSKSKISIGFGKDITGSCVVSDLASMPHLLIAGATGSGKSVCMNTLICSILFKATPEEVKIIMIDPKKVELAGYNGLPHLGRPVVTNPKKASMVLKEVVSEMERRYSLFAATGVKNFSSYNESDAGVDEKLPQIVVLIDELADLMMVVPHDVEDSICRLAQMARAAGIHLVIATQRPSVDVITGLIKANVPSRIAFAVSSSIDSRTILDGNGAEKLMGRGDMLFCPAGMNKPMRVQGAYIEEEDIVKLVDFWHEQEGETQFLELPDAGGSSQDSDSPADEDELFRDAVQAVIGSGSASASFLQRKLRVGYNRAARLIDSMEQLRIITPLEGNKRQVLMTWDEFLMLHGTGE